MQQYDDNEQQREQVSGTPGRERGFTLIEVAMVMVVVAIVMAIAIPTFMRQKSDASQSGFVDAARSYALAIEAFRVDNAGRAPRFGTAEWPTNAADKGPVNQLMAASEGRRRMYLRNGVPDGMVSGKGTISAQAATGNVNHIQYIQGAAPSLTYSLVVTSVGRNNTPKVCFLGTDPVASDVADTQRPFSCEKRQ